MGYSETIVAASIGAAATLLTASFQLFSAMRANKADGRPKRGRTLRSIVAIIALMGASAVGGFMYSELRQQRTAEDLRSMRQELNAQLQSLTTATQQLASQRISANLPQSMAVAGTLTMPDIKPQNAAPTSVDSEIYAPACQATAGCTEVSAQRASLCGMIPGNAKVNKVDLFLSPVGDDSKPEFQKVEADQDLGGAKFIGAPAEYKHGDNRKSACVDFIHWSEQPHIARLVLYYDTAVRQQPELTPPAVVASQTPAPEQTLHPVSLSLAQSP
jgi:hypothetical protein